MTEVVSLPNLVTLGGGGKYRTRVTAAILRLVAAAAAVRGEAAGIFERSHKVEKKLEKKFNLKQYFLIFTNK